jgi:hypothetical protein
MGDREQRERKVEMWGGGGRENKKEMWGREGENGGRGEILGDKGELWGREGEMWVEQ